MLMLMISDCAAEEKVPWVAAVVTFLVLAVAGVVVVLAVVYRNNITHFLCPKDSLPEHFKEVCLCLFVLILVYECSLELVNTSINNYSLDTYKLFTF